MHICEHSDCKVNFCILADYLTAGILEIHSKVITEVKFLASPFVDIVAANEIMHPFCSAQFRFVSFISAELDPRQRGGSKPPVIFERASKLKSSIKVINRAGSSITSKISFHLAAIFLSGTFISHVNNEEEIE